KGAYNQQPVISLNTAITLNQASDLKYLGQLTSAEFIEVERMLYNRGRYNAALRNDYTEASPIVSLLHAAETGQLDRLVAERQIAEFGQHDVRDEMGKYLYRQPINQQYQLSLQGGAPNQKFSL